MKVKDQQSDSEWHFWRLSSTYLGINSSTKPTLNKPVTTNNIPSNQQMNPSINHSSGAANCKSTLRSRLFMAMQQLINLVDNAQKAHLGRHKTTANQVLQSSQVHHHHKPKADVVLEDLLNYSITSAEIRLEEANRVKIPPTDNISDKLASVQIDPFRPFLSANSLVNLGPLETPETNFKELYLPGIPTEEPSEPVRKVIDLSTYRKKKQNRISTSGHSSLSAQSRTSSHARPRSEIFGHDLAQDSQPASSRVSESRSSRQQTPADQHPETGSGDSKSTAGPYKVQNFDGNNQGMGRCRTQYPLRV
ncbi:hypothetical protein BY996DRAFT_6487901 [Phakopsora pachyrhizi]|nr:hypothetical protein BY996DRAFT_6487901 [Phakopsora pachyrhizi]